MSRRNNFKIDGRYTAMKAAYEPVNPIEENDLYLVLDSFHKLATSEISRGTFQWNIMVQGVTSDEAIGISDTLDNITQIELSSFVMPIPPEVPYILRNPEYGENTLSLIPNNSVGLSPILAQVGQAIYEDGGPSSYGQYPTNTLWIPNLPYHVGGVVRPWINNPYTQLPYGNRMTIQLKEAGLQSYSDCNGARHNFEFIVSHNEGNGTNPNFLLATPNKYDGGVFNFAIPLIDLTSFTLVFRGPDYPISFDNDVYFNVSVLLDTSSTPGPYLYFKIPTPALNAGDRIFVKNFNCSIDSIARYVNRVEGHVINGIPVATPSLQFVPGQPLAVSSIDPNFVDTYTDPAIGISSFVNPSSITLSTATVYIAKRRLRISLRAQRRGISRRPCDPRSQWNRE